MKYKKKRCPRCNRKLDPSEPKCDTCGLIFDRLNLVSNSAGIKALKNHQENKVIYVTNPPRDIDKWKLFFISLFFGFLGVQYYKVGRNKWFVFMMFAFAITLTFGLLEYYNIFDMTENIYLNLLLYFKYLPGAIATIMWGGSTFQIAFNFFKYPVSIDENFAVEDLNTTVAKDILESIHKDRELEQEINKQVRKHCHSCGKHIKVSKGEKVCPLCGKNIGGVDNNEQ